MFILASSFCKSLQCLISTLTQGGKGGHLFRLTCSFVLWEGRNYKQISPACVGSACSVLATLGLPLLYTAQAPGCSAGELSKAGPGLRAVPRSKPLRFRFLGTPQRHRLTWACFVPFPVPSSSGDQVLGEHSPSWVVYLITSPVPAAWSPRCAMRAQSQVCCVSPLGS